jgi:hypothetical protein
MQALLLELHARTGRLRLGGFSKDSFFELTLVFSNITST